MAERAAALGVAVAASTASGAPRAAAVGAIAAAVGSGGGVERERLLRRAGRPDENRRLLASSAEAVDGTVGDGLGGSDGALDVAWRSPTAAPCRAWSHCRAGRAKDASAPDAPNRETTSPTDPGVAVGSSAGPSANLADSSAGSSAGLAVKSAPTDFDRSDHLTAELDSGSGPESGAIAGAPAEGRSRSRAGAAGAISAIAVGGGGKLGGGTGTGIHS